MTTSRSRSRSRSRTSDDLDSATGGSGVEKQLRSLSLSSTSADQVSFDEINKHSCIKCYSNNNNNSNTSSRETSSYSTSTSSVSLELEGKLVHGKSCLCQPVMENRNSLTTQGSDYKWHFRVDNLVEQSSGGGGGIAFGVATRKVNFAKGLALFDADALSASKGKRKNSISSSSSSSSSAAAAAQNFASSQTVGGDTVAWCIYSSKHLGKTVSVCGDRTKRYGARPLRNGDVVTLNVSRKKAKIKRDDSQSSLSSSSSSSSGGEELESSSLVLTTVSVQVNFVNWGTAFEFSGDFDLFAGVSFYSNKQRLTLFPEDVQCSDSSFLDLKKCRDECSDELALIGSKIEETKAIIREQFEKARADLAKQEHALTLTLDEAQARYIEPLQNQTKLFDSLHATASSSSSGQSSQSQRHRKQESGVSCPPVPVFNYEMDVRGVLSTCLVKKPVVTTQEAFDNLELQSKKLAKTEKELAKTTKKLATTKEDLDKKKKYLKRCNPLVPTDLVHHVYASGWDCPKGGQKSFWEKFLQVSAMEKISIHTHPDLLSSWVEQKSPSCAAAAVAGAFNILSSRWRELQGNFGGGDGAVSETPEETPDAPVPLAVEGKKKEAAAHDDSSSSSCMRLQGSDIIAMYVARWEKAVRAARRDIMELLNVSSLDDDRTEESEEQGGGNGEDLLNIIAAALEGKYGIEFHPKLDGLDLFLPSCVHTALDAWDADPGAKKEVKHAFNHSRKEIESKVKTWWGKLGGLSKLTAEKPSTAPIGNDTILKIFEKVRDDYGAPIRTWRFMSSKKCQCQVSESDDDIKITAHWNNLKACVANPSQVLLFHLQNHYSMIYAARENDADTGYGGKHLIRQVLVAKPGQQPCRWIDFVSVRETILSWVGHAIIGVELENVPEMVVL